MNAFSIQEAQELANFAEQFSERLARARAELGEAGDSVAAERDWLEVGSERISASLQAVRASLADASQLPEFAPARKQRAETLSSAWADAIERVFDGIVANVSANGPLIEALFPHQRFAALRRPGTAAHNFWLEFERRADSSYVKRLCGDPEYQFLAPLLDAAKASERALRDAATPAKVPEEEADRLRAAISEAAQRLELALRQSRSLIDAAFAATPERVAGLGLDAKPKRKSPRAEPAKLAG